MMWSIYSLALKQHMAIVTLSCKYSTGICAAEHKYQACKSRLASNCQSLPKLQSQKPLSVGWFASRRSFLSAVSANGFNDYDLERKQFNLQIPKYFNFANITDEWAAQERAGKRKTKVPAFWWINDHGDEIKYTFQDLEFHSKKVANILINDCHLQKGDVVMSILPRVPEWWILNIACMRAGLILTSGTVLLTLKDIEGRLVSSEAKCILADDDVAETVDKAAHVSEHLTHKILVSENSLSRTGWLDYRELYEKASPEHQCVQIKSNHTLNYFFTSGTTGLPKMVEHTHASGGLSHVLFGKYFLDAVPSDMLWCVSDTGWAKSAFALFGPWMQGAGIFIHHSKNKFESLQVLEILEKYPITMFCLPPTGYRMLVQEDVAKYKLTHLRNFVSAGEPLNPEVVTEWQKATREVIRQGYGQSETTLLCGMFKCLKYQAGSMGKPSPGVDLCIVGDDHSTVLPPGEEGTIAVRMTQQKSLGVFKGYKNDPERTASVFRNDFYFTGDRAIMDEEGYYWFVGRDDDVIISAGYRIGPFEVESALQEHPAVVESAAVSSPDSIRGELVKAFVVLSEAFKNVDKEKLAVELQEHVKSTTAPYKYPRKIEFVDTLPKTVSGKTRRVELRESEWRGHTHY